VLYATFWPHRLRPFGWARRAPAHPVCRRDLPDLFDGSVIPQQAADLSMVTKRTIRDWRRAGLIEPVTMPSGRAFYRLDDLFPLVEGGTSDRVNSE
jgi:hypothetical protein